MQLCFPFTTDEEDRPGGSVYDARIFTELNGVGEEEFAVWGIGSTL
jgi:hypothetical protein